MVAERLEYLALEQLHVKPQVRQAFDEEALHGLGQSMKEVGQLQPVRVRLAEGKHWIVDGERRYRAAKLAGLKGLSVIVEGASLDEGGVVQRQLIANCQREDLKPLEKADAVSRLMAVTGWNATQAATKLGLSNATVTRLMALLTLPDEVRCRIASGEIAPSAAYELSRVSDPAKQAELVQQVVNGGLTRDGLAGVRKNGGKKAAGETTTAASSRATAQLGDGRSVTVLGQSLDLEDFIAILEELLAKARKVRPQGVQLKSFLSMLKDQAETA